MMGGLGDADQPRPIRRIDDQWADSAVAAHYAARRETGTILPGPDDSSTGLCQIFARIAIRANTWAFSKGIISTRSYNIDDWRDVADMWEALATDEEFNIRMAALTMMMEATGPGAADHTRLRHMTPSQVMAMCVGYDNSWFDDSPAAYEKTSTLWAELDDLEKDHHLPLGESSMFYGRRRMQLYYVIKRWHQAF